MRILIWKKRESDLESGYKLKIEIGIVLSLLILLVLFNVHLGYETHLNLIVHEPDVIHVDDIQSTTFDKPVPPPLPQVPVPVSNDETIPDDIPYMSTELNAKPITGLKPPTTDADKPKDNTTPVPFLPAEYRPKLIGGLSGLLKNVRYPTRDRMAGIEGTVIIQFVVNKKGVPTDLKVVRSVTASLDQSAIDAIKKARFTPGLQRGRPVPVQMSIPIRFKLKNH